jgi:lipid A ethanolaminephosphotransferase
LFDLDARKKSSHAPRAQAKVCLFRKKDYFLFGIRTRNFLNPLRPDPAPHNRDADRAGTTRGSEFSEQIDESAPMLRLHQRDRCIAVLDRIGSRATKPQQRGINLLMNATDLSLARPVLKELMLGLRHAASSAWHFRPLLGSEVVSLFASLFFSVFCNYLFWNAALGDRAWSAFGTWSFVALTFMAITALHFILLCLVASRWTIKPLLSALLIATAMAVYYMHEYTVFLDATMLRNVLHTQAKEARELLTPGLLTTLFLYAMVPIALLLRIRIVRRSWSRALLVRSACLGVAIVVAATSVWLNYQPLSALWRNQPEVRYLVTPANFLSSTSTVLFADARERNKARIPIGTDAMITARPAGAKPRLLVIVVGETVRAANWGLNGYARQTTPELSALDVINFPDVTSCGTNTEVSVPCMFSAIGRRHYDEKRIRQEQSLLHVLERAGVKTLWRDNQTGCKGVCEGLTFEQLNDARDPALCKNGLCLDEILLGDLEQKIHATPGDMVVVLHQLGNHGPSYFLRYPDHLRRYTPTCDTAELGSCSSEQVVNAYDNALLYTDHFLARTIELLQAEQGHDAAMIYVSDHGESLGEHGLYLHGVPYAIAPKEQIHVPMVMWFSDAFAADTAIDLACTRQRAAEPASHDNLFHSVLGLLGVGTQIYDPSLDLLHDCRKA